MDSVSYIPPARRSMSDDELANLLSRPHASEASLLEAMQVLESQTRLREEDDAAIAAWCSQMRSLNTADSLAALNVHLGVPDSAPMAVTPVLESSIAPPPEAPAASSPPKSLFEELAAAASAATPQQQFVAASPVLPAPPVVSEQPAPEPSASVEENSQQEEIAEPALEIPDAQVDAVDVPPTASAQAVFPLVPIVLPMPAADSQQVTPETHADSAVGSAEQEALELEEGSDKPELGEFDQLLAIAPQSSAAYLDDAKASVSTAHSVSSNQRASSLFFNWLPIVASVVPVILAVYLHSLGLGLTESVTAFSVAVFAAFVTTTTGAIAGKRSGLQTFIVSRATFGVYGARIPAAVFAVLKLAAASVFVLLLVIASDKAQTGWSVEGVSATRWPVGPISVALWQVIIGLSVAVVAAISFVKLRYVKFLNLILGFAAFAFVVASLAIRLASSPLELSFKAIESWPMTLGSSALVFAAFGTLWSSSGADFASGLKKEIRGSNVVGWSFLSLFVVPVAIGVATLLVMQGTPVSFELLSFASILPEQLRPYGFGVLGALILLLAALELRSTRLALMAVNGWFGSNIARAFLALAFVALSLAGWHFYSTQGILYNLKDYALICSIPVAAWLGIFTTDTLFRRIAFHEVSLTRSYGFYGNFNWVNLVGWAVASGLGFGFITSSLQEFQWTGFLSKLSVNPPFWSDANLGLALAFAIGVLMPLVLGIPRIRRQEAEVLAIESRRYELRDVIMAGDSSPQSDSASNE